MSEPSTAVIVGASAGVGRAIAEAAARRGWNLVLAARDLRDLQAEMRHLQTRYGISVHAYRLDLAEPGEVNRFVDACTQLMGRVDAVFLTAGMIAAEDDGLSPPAVTERLVRVNFLSIAQIASRFLSIFESQQKGRLVLFSSIAAFAPRAKNVMYAASKSALGTFARGLQHRYADTGIRVQLYMPGYIDTNMSFGQRLLFPVATPEAFAESVVRSLDRPLRVRYYPRFWKIVVAALRGMPWSLYKRLKF